MLVFFLRRRNLPYGKEVDHQTRFRNIPINNHNFLSMLVKAQPTSYIKDNILGAWRRSGLIPPKMRTYYDPAKQARSTPPPPVPPTPRSLAVVH